MPTAEQLQAKQRFFTNLPKDGINLRGQPQRGQLIPEVDGIQPVSTDGVIWSFLIHPDDPFTQRDINSQNWTELHRRLDASMQIAVVRGIQGTIPSTEIVIFQAKPDAVVQRKDYTVTINKQEVNEGTLFPAVAEGAPIAPTRVLSVTRRSAGQNDTQLRRAAVSQVLATR